ncbi:ABC transporter permease [Limisphaera sp. 4302-co]|uniref:ABC transporter permease n=1 Tax=Limisphaera sp. 4302-co TaxID=3400417 RepID=UPI003C262F42
MNAACLSAAPSRASWHRIRQTLRLGLRSLWLHRLRSLLTVLGIVCGVCSVIAMLAIGEGASYEAQEQIKNLGSQNIILRSVKPPEDRKVSERATQSFVLEYGLTHTDLRRIRATIPGVTVIVPARVIRKYAWNLTRRVDCEVVGTVPWYPEIRSHTVAVGRFFTDLDMQARANVCVVEAELVPLLFPLELPLGRQIRIGSRYYRVIGVMAPQVERRSRESEPAAVNPAATPQAERPRIYIPLETARIRYGETLIRQRSGTLEAERVALHEVIVQVHRLEEVTPVAESIRPLLEHGHDKRDFEIVVPWQLLRRAERTKQLFNVVLGSIAAISLLVGGIGIMNIMLASVTERTREIGIRRALGARRRDIVLQFLVETVLLSASGGLLGILLGAAIPFAVTQWAGMKTIITWWSPALAFGISALVGVVFGLYPALRAARMDPVEALRHE